MPPNEQDVVPIFAPTPKLSYGTNRTNSSYNHPAALDPNQYMVNDGIIEHWDAWENVWHKAFLDLNVSTRDKHTKGITKVPMKKNPLLSSISSHASGVQSSFTSTKENRNDILSDEEIMHPILAIDSGHTNLTVDNHNVSGTGTKYQQSIQQKQRATMIEIMYESFHAPATFIAPSPMLAAFGNGRQTALVVDIGANGTRVTPIVEGMVLQQAQRRNGRGGEYISAVQEYVLRSKILKKDIVPRYIVKARGKNDENDYESFMKKIKIGGFHQVQDSIFHQMALRDVMYEMKTSPHVEGVALYRHNEWTIPFLNHDEDYEDDEEMELVDESVMVMEGDVNENENGQERKGMQGNHAQKNFYQLPDGTVISLENKKVKDIKRLPELLFAAELPFLSSDEDTESKSDCLLHPTLSNLPLHELVKDSLSAVADADVRKELCGNIVLTGAASLCANIESRMSLEIQYLVPKIYRCKVIASRNTVERKFASWIGGSILSSLGSFQQLWLSKKEYEEYGMTLATERFP
jgi:actin-related protein